MSAILPFMSNKCFVAASLSGSGTLASFIKTKLSAISKSWSDVFGTEEPVIENCQIFITDSSAFSLTGTVGLTGTGSFPLPANYVFGPLTITDMNAVGASFTAGNIIIFHGQS